MGGIFGGAGGQVQGPGSVYSSTGSGISDAKPSGVVGPPGEISKGDPTELKTSKVTVSEKSSGRDTDVNPTWEQRALLLLTSLQAEKVFKDLKPKLRAEVGALIEDAPDGARS